MFASSPRLTIIAGALASASLALLAARDAPDFASRLEERAAQAIAEAGAPPVTVPMPSSTPSAETLAPDVLIIALRRPTK